MPCADARLYCPALFSFRLFGADFNTPSEYLGVMCNFVDCCSQWSNEIMGDKWGYFSNLNNLISEKDLSRIKTISVIPEIGIINIIFCYSGKAL